ncbi:methyltransferase domain-containing protein [Metamycoplasma phocicerebrale]|uniref:Methyltransferase domain-containing protein n=1 Tax=Metamycoplasma phocicerebrale TaxID=142649 RepID=A0A3T0TUP9_9BACT|nr:class I SAM-dependent methyltransferase [Metamycoplasma phocicerebrale]AZZ65763.1 methyltransferase domain-containing protein [Metamycoplasma phocicerebrale]
MNKIDKINKKHYKEEAIQYEKTNLKGLWKSEIEIFKKYLKPNQTILEIGTGTGRVSTNLFNIFPKLNILAVDYSQDMLDRFPKDMDIKHELLDITEYKNTLNNKFDVILFMFNGFENIIEESAVIKALKNINSYLKKDGIFIFTIHEIFSNLEFQEFWNERLFKNNNWENKTLEIQEKNKNSIFHHFYTNDDIVKKLKEANFQILEKKNRNEFEEFQWVKDYSKSCDFYVVKKVK